MAPAGRALVPRQLMAERALLVLRQLTVVAGHHQDLKLPMEAELLQGRMPYTPLAGLRLALKQHMILMEADDLHC